MLRVEETPPTAEDSASVDRAGEELHCRGWSKRFSGGDDRWATRLPKVLVGELAEDADRMGLGKLRR